MPHIDLLELPPFANIPMGEVVSLIDAMAPRQWPSGQTLLDAGAVPEALLVITAGSVRSDGPAAPPGHVRPAPLVLPVTAFFARSGAPDTVIATSAVSAFALHYRTFEQLLVARHPALARFLHNLLTLQSGLHACPAVG